MKKIIMLGLAALMTVAAMAQDGEKPDMAKMAKNHAEQLSKTLELTGDAKSQFEDLYVQYASELAGEPQEPREEGADEQAEGGRRGKKGELTEAQATERLNQMLQRQEKQIAEQQRRLEVQKKYIPEFQKTLTPQQVLKVIQGPQRRRQGMNGQRNGQRMNGGMGGARPGGMGGGFGGPQRGDFGGGDF